MSANTRESSGFSLFISGIRIIFSFIIIFVVPYQSYCQHLLQSFAEGADDYNQKRQYHNQHDSMSWFIKSTFILNLVGPLTYFFIPLVARLFRREAGAIRFQDRALMLTPFLIYAIFEYLLIEMKKQNNGKGPGYYLGFIQACLGNNNSLTDCHDLGFERNRDFGKPGFRTPEGLYNLMVTTSAAQVIFDKTHCNVGKVNWIETLLPLSYAIFTAYMIWHRYCYPYIEGPARFMPTTQPSSMARAATTALGQRPTRVGDLPAPYTHGPN